MRVFDEYKITELFTYDLEIGYLKEDRILKAHHPAISEVKEKGHYEVAKEYANGGKDLIWIVDIPAVKPQDAWDEYEDIMIYIPYTAEQLLQKKNKDYEQMVDSLIRQKYSLSAELAILRQKDTKPSEFYEYNAYAESCKYQAKAKFGIV